MEVTKTIKEIIRYKDLVKELVSKDLKLKYRRSFLGYIWSILNPLGIMLVMVVVFSTMFRWEITNFAVYLIIGQTMFNYMNSATTHSIYSILDNAPLLKKIYVPKYIFTFSKVTSDLVDFLFSMGAMFLVMIVTRTQPSIYLLLIPIVALQLYIFSLGISLFMSAASVFFRDIQYIYAVFLTAWGYLTPIFYPITALPDKLRWLIIRFNPMYYYIQQMRQIVLDCTYPDYKLVGAGFLVAFCALFFGYWVFKKNQSKFILYI